MTDPKIDYEKIAKSECLYYQTANDLNLVVKAMRQTAIEAIRLAAPLFAERACLCDDTDGLQDSWGNLPTIVSKQSILDAVESVTKKIAGE